MKKQFIALLVSVLLLLSLTACGASSSDTPVDSGSASEGTGEETTLWVTGITANLYEGEHPFYQALTYFDESLREKTDNRYGLEIYVSAQLGSDTEMVDGVMNGTYPFVMTSSGYFASISDDFNIFDFPYLFDSADHAYRVLDSEIGEEVLATLDRHGMVGLGFGESGFRNLTANRAVLTPEDLQGMKVRTMDIPMHIETFNTLGANATPTAWAEAFTALQQGTIDSQENLNMALVSSNLYEVQNHVMLTEHLYTPTVYVMNKDYFEGLTPEDQQAIREAVAESIERQRTEATRQNNAALNDVEQNHGMTVIREIDKTPWIAGVQPMYEKYAPIYGEYFRRIEAMK